MVKRHPHKAKITYSTSGRLVGGEWVDGSIQEIEIDGRYDPLSTNDVIRVNSQGNEVIVRGEFYTKHEKIEGAVSLEIAELGINHTIICWWPYQSHSVISV